MEFIYEGIKYVEEQDGLVVLGFSDENYNQNLEIPAFVKGIPVVEIGKDAFATRNIRTAVLPASLSVIRYGAFALCFTLKEVSFFTTDNFQEKDALIIEKHAFWCCEYLEYIMAGNRTIHICEAGLKRCCSLIQLQCVISCAESESLQFCRQLEGVVFANDAIIDNYVFGNTGITQLVFIGNATIAPITLSDIWFRQIKILCVENSNLTELAYDGFKIELFSNM